jgi:outer membrane protein assembly factor BamA
MADSMVPMLDKMNIAVQKNNEYDLVFKLHLFFGFAAPLKTRTIPYNELFHIGGDATVRGFAYGQVGPRFLPTADYPGDPIGAKKAFFLNSELWSELPKDNGWNGNTKWQRRPGFRSLSAWVIRRIRFVSCRSAAACS